MKQNRNIIIKDMKTIKLLFLGGLAILLATTSCIDDLRVEGNGIPATENRNTSSFNKVKSSGSFDVYIEKGETFEVSVRAEENLLHHIETHVSGDHLNIDVHGINSLRNTLPMEVFITMPELNGVNQSGSGLITTDRFETKKMDLSLSGSGLINTSFDADQVEVSISGSGTLKLAGEAKEAYLRISGSGKIEATQLELNECQADISGSGNMAVSVDEYLEAVISGSGNVLYYGSPEVKTHISGSGHVTRNN